MERWKEIDLYLYHFGVRLRKLEVLETIVYLIVTMGSGTQ